MPRKTPEEGGANLVSLSGGKDQIKHLKRSPAEIRNDLIVAIAKNTRELIDALYVTASSMEKFKKNGEVKYALYDTDSSPMTMGYNNQSVAFTASHLLEVGEEMLAKQHEEAEGDSLQYGLQYAANILLLRKKLTEVTDNDYLQTDIGDGIAEEDKQATAGTGPMRSGAGQNIVYNEPLGKIAGFPKEIKVKKSEET